MKNIKIAYSAWGFGGWCGRTEDGQLAVGQTKPQVRKNIQAARGAYLAQSRAAEELRDLRLC